MDNEVLSSFFDLAGGLNLGKVLTLIVGMVFIVIIVKVIKNGSIFLYNQFPRQRLILLQLFTTLSFLIYFVGTIGLVYTTLQPTNEVLLAMAGTAAVAFGFALKDYVSSLVAGIILLFDRPFQVGDRVSFDGKYGEIKNIGLRAVRLVTLDDNLVTIPNNKFVTDIVASANAGELNMMVETLFHVAIDEDFENIRNLIYEVIVTSRFAYLSKPIIITAKEAEFARQLTLEIAVKAYVLDTKYEKAFETDLVIRSNKVFRDKKIRRPYSLPQTVDD
jgi:small-conductance mechanosensitive channel